MNAHEYFLPRQRLYVVGCTELLPSNIAYSLGLETSAFITASEFLRSVPELATGCLLVAGELPDGTGLGLHREVASRALDLTTVMVLDIENVRMFVTYFQFEDPKSDSFMKNALLAINGAKYLADNFEKLRPSLTEEEEIEIVNSVDIAAKRMESYKSELLSELEQEFDDEDWNT